MKYYSHVVYVLLYFPLVCTGAKAPYSEEKLQQVATHIVVGKVQAIYSFKQVEDISLMSSFNYERKVAEVVVKKVTKENVKLELFKVDLKIEDKIVRHATCGDVEEQKRIENNLESLWYQKHCLVEFAKSQGIEDVEV